MMEEKKIVIFLKADQFYGAMAPDHMELISEGTLATLEDGTLLLTYQETELSDMAGVTTQFAISGDTVTLTRSGAIQSVMRFEQGKRHSSLYETPWGAMTVDVVTLRLRCRMGDRGGFMEIIYNVTIDQYPASRNRFLIRVQESMREQP